MIYWTYGVIIVGCIYPRLNPQKSSSRKSPHVRLWAPTTSSTTRPTSNPCTLPCFAIQHRLYLLPSRSRFLSFPINFDEWEYYSYIHSIYYVFMANRYLMHGNVFKWAYSFMLEPTVYIVQHVVSLWDVNNWLEGCVEMKEGMMIELSVCHTHTRMHTHSSSVCFSVLGVFIMGSTCEMSLLSVWWTDLEMRRIDFSGWYGPDVNQESHSSLVRPGRWSVGRLSPSSCSSAPRGRKSPQYWQEFPFHSSNSVFEEPSQGKASVTSRWQKRKRVEIFATRIVWEALAGRIQFYFMDEICFGAVWVDSTNPIQSESFQIRSGFLAGALRCDEKMEAKGDWMNNYGLQDLLTILNLFLRFRAEQHSRV